MPETPSSYVAKFPSGGWRVTGSRISLDSIVHAYWQGRTPEAIVADFPPLILEQVHGAIAYYLGHRDVIDAHLDSQRGLWEELHRESESQHARLLQRIRSDAGGGHDDVP